MPSIQEIWSPNISTFVSKGLPFLELSLILQKRTEKLDELCCGFAAPTIKRISHQIKNLDLVEFNKKFSCE